MRPTEVTTERDGAAEINVEVVYALPDRYWSVDLQLTIGATVAQALTESRIERLIAGIQIDPDRLAIFSRPAQLSTVLNDHDRLEILRPLVADPKQARRARAVDSMRKKR